MKKIFIALALSLLPSAAFAATDVSNLLDLINQLRTLINAFIPLLFGVALISFIIGIIKYIWAGGNALKIKEARNYIFFSIIGIAVMLSVWSLALFVKDSFFPNAPASYNVGTGTVGGGFGNGGSTGGGLLGGGTGGGGGGSSLGTGGGGTGGIGSTGGGGGNAPDSCTITSISGPTDGATCSSPYGQGVCKNQVCTTPPRANGVGCQSATDCQSGYCNFSTYTCDTPGTADECTGKVDYTPCGADGTGQCVGGTCVSS